MTESSGPSTNELLELLARVEQGELSVRDAANRIQNGHALKTASTDHASLDLDRRRRCGYPEVVFAQGKSVAAIVEIFETLVGCGEDCFATRVSPEQASALLATFPKAVHNSIARTVCLEQRTDRTTAGLAVVITAGTSDRPVAEEALETLRFMGCETDLIVDVGVAGPHRLQEQRERFAHADAIVVVAGMEGALPSVVGGCVSCPVIAVPTSVGYGASFNGIAALLGMLNSCAANVTVVNIDAGFKGGYVAGLIARQAANRKPE